MIRDEILDINEAIKLLENQTNPNNYIINYLVIDKFIKVIASNGKWCKVKNNKTNTKKLDQMIVKNKVTIAKMIDNYEDNYRERIAVILANLSIVFGSGILVPFSFFTGILAFFAFSILFFIFSATTVVMSGVKLYQLVKEIKTLKELTGYKLDNEFKFDGFKLLRGRN